MPELALQRDIVMPLLSEIGFGNVRENSGPGEHGKDVVATKDDLGGPLLYAFQIKRVRLTAKAGDARSLGRHLDQLGQTLQEPVIDPISNRFRLPDKCVLVTPYPVSSEARSAFNERTQAAGRQGIKVLDGVTILDLVRQSAPYLLERFSQESRYRMNLVYDVTHIHETAAALALPSYLVRVPKILTTSFPEILATSR